MLHPHDASPDPIPTFVQEEMMTWPNTPGMKRYLDAAALFEILIDAEEIDEYLTDMLNAIGDRDFYDVVLKAMEDMATDSTIGVVVHLPVTPSLTDQMNPQEIAYETPLVLETGDFAIGMLSRHPDWMGLSPILTLLKGMDAMVFEGKNTPGKAASIIACPKTETPEFEAEPLPFPPGETTILRDLLAWHGATPIWIESEDTDGLDLVC